MWILIIILCCVYDYIRAEIPNICSSVIERSTMVRWVVGSIHYGGPIKLFLVPAWCNKGRGVYSPICNMVHILNQITVEDRLVSDHFWLSFTYNLLEPSPNTFRAETFLISLHSYITQH